MTRAGSRSPLAPGRTLPATVVDETVAAAAILLEKWHPDEDSFGSSLFLDSTPDEVDAFLRAAKDLHRAMLFYASGVATNADALHARGHGLIHAQELLDTAMRRLQRELQELLTSSRHGAVGTFLVRRDWFFLQRMELEKRYTGYAGRPADRAA